MITQLHQEEKYPLIAWCRLLGLPRSTYYYRTCRRDEAALCGAIETMAAEYPTYGSRRLTALLRRAPYHRVVNRKRVQRLLRQMGLGGQVRHQKHLTTDSQHPYPRYSNLVAGLPVTYPDQVWVSDITYIRLGSEFVYLAVVMDVFTRAIRGWYLYRSLDQELTLTALRRALTYRTPAIHHSDQGVQYAAQTYTELLKRHQVQISMAAAGAAWENAYAERLIRTIKEEEVDLSEYLDFADAYAQIGHFIEQVYQRKRIHSALGYLTPAEYETVWQQQQAEASSLILT